MRILFIGGTGNISTACSREALKRGHDLVLLTRGRRQVDLPGATFITADISDEASTAAVLGNQRFDAVVNFIAFTVEQVERDLRLFAQRCAQYVFISSASCYSKPLPIPVIESSPVGNALWPYSQRKVACEERLWQARDAGVGVTIVRPSHTYDSILPLALGGDWTLCARMLAGKPVVVPGDGTSIWTVTHSDDFALGLVGLLGNSRALGEAFHITGDELLTWSGIHREVAAALGVEAQIVPMVSDAICAYKEDLRGSLWGDKSHSAIFDNTKIKDCVPGFRQRIRFAEGIRRTLGWFRADPQRQTVRSESDAFIDGLIRQAGYEIGTKGITPPPAAGQASP